MRDLEDCLKGQDEPERRESVKDFFMDLTPIYGDYRILRNGVKEGDMERATTEIGLKYCILGDLALVVCLTYYIGYLIHDYLGYIAR